MSNDSNTNNEIGELSLIELDTIVGGTFGHTLGMINYGVGLAMQGGMVVAGLALRGASEMAADVMMKF
jgi:hypothetical protein